MKTGGRAVRGQVAVDTFILSSRHSPCLRDTRIAGGSCGGSHQRTSLNTRTQSCLLRAPSTRPDQLTTPRSRTQSCGQTCRRSLEAKVYQTTGWKCTPIVDVPHGSPTGFNNSDSMTNTPHETKYTWSWTPSYQLKFCYEQLLPTSNLSWYSFAWDLVESPTTWLIAHGCGLFTPMHGNSQ